MQVTIIDTRPDWMLREDRLMTCMLHCRIWRKCVSRMGEECKHLGGSEIPKIRK